MGIGYARRLLPSLYALGALATLAAGCGAGQDNAPLRAGERLSATEETALPIEALPWPRQLQPDQIDHLVVDSQKAAFVCADRLRQITNENEAAVRTSRSFTLATAIVSATTAAGTAGLQMLKDDGARADATGILAAAGSLTAAILGSIAAYKGSEVSVSSTGKRIGEIQNAVKQFVDNWTKLISNHLPDAGSCQTEEAGPRPSAEQLIVAQIDLDGGGGFVWTSVPYETFFSTHNAYGGCQLPAADQRTLYLLLASELNGLLSTCTTRPGEGKSAD